MPAQAYLSSPMSAETVVTITKNLATIRNNPTNKSNRLLFVDIVTAMTEETTEFYFYKPMDIIQASSITRKFVRIGISSSVKMVSTMGKKAIGFLDEQQMLQLCDFIESLINQKD